MNPPPPQPPQPSLKAIAQVTGFAVSTVSAALRNLPNIPPQTRQAIRAAADRLGYQPDAHVSRLMAYLRRRRGRRPQAVPLAWIDLDVDPAHGQTPWNRGYAQGARDRAQSLGYRIEPFWAHDPKAPIARLNRALRTRGIQGALLPCSTSSPVERERALRAIDVSRLAAVRLGFSTNRFEVSAVQPDAFANLSLALKHLAARGYKKPGLWLDWASNYQFDGALDARMASPFTAAPGMAPIPTALFRWDLDWHGSFVEWVRRHNPDVVICSNNELLDLLIKNGWNVPRDIGLIHLNICSDVSDWAGIDQGHERLGAAAVDMVVAQLQRCELGPPPQPSRVCLLGNWVEGKTVRALPPGREVRREFSA